ncbi:MAG: hypothetical protein ABJ275_10525 [Maricaulaceae bacterium]
MSRHVARAENRSIFPVLILAVLAITLVLFFMKPRSVIITTKPPHANLYVDGQLVCDVTPCHIDALPLILPEIISDLEGYNREIVNPDYMAHIFSGQQALNINHVLIVRPPLKTPEKHMPIIKRQQDKNGEGERDEALRPNKLKEIADDPREIPKRGDKPITKRYIKAECIEAASDRQRYNKRAAEICYENDKRVKAETIGECYALYTVTTAGKVEDVTDYGCMDDNLNVEALAAFRERQYLPALLNGQPIKSDVEGVIKYSSAIIETRKESQRQRYSRLKDETITEDTVNRDASVSDCPTVDKGRNLSRSGHCIIEFDVSREAKISKIRSLACTEAHLKDIALDLLSQCHVTAAMSDEQHVDRPYLKHQIDMNIYNETGQLIPPPSAFGHNVKNKPYVIFDAK